jgi:hypothetical protein
MSKVLCTLFPDPDSGFPPRTRVTISPVVGGYTNGRADFCCESNTIAF